MPNLSQTLPSNDIGFVRIVASLWGVDLTSPDSIAASLELADAICDAELVEEVVSTLPKDGRAALEALAEAGGRIPWGMFTRRFGELREMGAGKRDREQPHLHPNSAAEILWYRALLAKAFFDTDQGPQEFAFIPDDLSMALDFMGIAGENQESPEKEEKQKTKEKNSAAVDSALGRPASPAEKAFPTLATDRILDDACTLLAALRMGIQPPETGIAVSVVLEFLSAAKILLPSPARRGAGGEVEVEVQPEPVKNFLEATRAGALETLVAAWQDSESFNELRQIPGFSCEGEWKNEPLVTREFLLNLLEAVPEKRWWSIPAFVRDVKTKYPDFQRPAGDYDSWFIKRESDGVFLRGFAHWDNVDGALIRYFISGPLFWLGMVDLASPKEGAAPTAFRARADIGYSIIDNRVPNIQYPVSNIENAKISVVSNGKISVPRLTPRVARYQVARFCEWDAENAEKADEYHYRVTPPSLARAREQGLKSEHLIGVLRKYASAPLPPPFVRAIQRWEVNGSEARIENVVVLRVSKPEVLNELRASKAGRFLGEVLGPVTAVVKPGAQPKVLAALAEMGLLAELSIDFETGDQ